MMKLTFRQFGVFRTLILWILLSFIGLYATTGVGTEIVNVAHARYQDPGGFEYQIQSPPVSTTVSGGYIVQITKEALTHVVMPSDTVIYRIDVENTGNIAVSSVTIIDTIRNGQTYVSSQPAATVNSQVLSWDLQTIQPGASASIELRCLAAPGLLPGIILENQAHVRAPNGAMGHSETVGVLIGSEPDLSISHDIDRSVAYAGDTLTYTFRVVNEGNAQATRAILRADLPFETEFVSASETGSHDAGIVTWDLGTILIGDEIQRSVRAVVKTGVNPGTTIMTTASVSSAEGSHANTQAMTQISDQVLQPNLILSRTSIPFASPGDTINYRIIYGNTGNCSATQTVLKDSLDDALIFLSATDAATYDPVTHEISWTIDELPDGEEDSVTVNVVVEKGIPDRSILENHARISCSEDQGASIIVYTSIRSPQLILQKTADSSHVSAGDEILYSIAFRNTGTGSASQTILRDTLASTLEYVSSDGNSSYDSDTRVVSWILGMLSSQMSSSDVVNLRVRTRIPLENGSVIRNTAGMDCYEGFSAVSGADIYVASSADLYISKAVQSRAYRGDTLNYQLSFGNTGNDVAHSVMISDTLAEEINVISSEGSYDYDPATRSIAWSIGDLAPTVDSSLSFKAIVLDVDSQIDRIENRAWIHSDEISKGSNTAVTGLNALLLEITADPDTILGNGSTETQITVQASNASGQAAPDGTPITLSTSHGNFTSTSNTLITINGEVQTTLRSSKIDQEYLPVNVKAELDDGSGVEDSIQVVFSALRITGAVTNSDGLPVEGAIVTIILDGVVIGTDTTGADGIYSIAIYESGNYIIRIQYPDGHGHYNTVNKDLDVNIDESDHPTTIDDLCSVSGRIIDYNTQEPINIPNIPVIIDLVDEGDIGKMAVRSLPDTTYTDSSGFFVFKDLQPGNYFIQTINDEDDLYHVGTGVVSVEKPGENKINVDIVQRPIVFKIYKTVDKTLAFGGDTLTYTLVYETVDNATTDTIEIMDQLPDEVEFIEGSIGNVSNIASYEYDPIDHALSFYRAGMPEIHRDSLTFSVLVKNGITSLITNEAVIRGRPDTAYTANDSRTSAETMILSPILAVSKKVNWPVAETGDVLTYSLTIENRSDTYDLYGLTINDMLPQGFRYKPGRTVLKTQQSDDPDITANEHHQSLVWTLSDTLSPGQSLELKYRVVVGLESPIGENTNIASATSMLIGGYDVRSNIASADVVIKPGMIQNRGLIFGKVFYDENGNHVHDRGEKTCQGIEIITEEGIRVTTDEFGKYSIPNARMGDHVLRINERTLPENTDVSLSSSDFLGDTGSRLVKVSYSGIAKANFPIKSTIDEHDAKEAIGYLSLDQRSETNSMRMVVNDAWSLLLKYSYLPDKGGFVLENSADVDRTVNFLKWQQQLQIEIMQRFDLAETGKVTRDPKETEVVKTPSQLVFESLKKRGIDESRMHLAEGTQVKQAVCDNIKSCVVELRLLSDEIVIDESQIMRMRHHITYSGGPDMKYMRLKTQFPEGFELAETVSKLNGKACKPIQKNKENAVWDVSEFDTGIKGLLEYDLIPVEATAIRTNSELQSYLELKPVGGRKMTSDPLRTVVPTLVEMIRFKVTLEGAQFDVGSYALKPVSIRSINKVGEFMQWQKDVSIVVEGFTDNTGNADKNKTLSQNRANAVKEHLMNKFKISSDRIEIRGYGEEFPVATNNTTAGRALNRRVEIILNSNFIQQGAEETPVLQDELKMRVKKRKILNTTQ